MKHLLVSVSFMFILIFEGYANQVWIQKANLPAVARHRTTSFSIGNKGYMGLGHYNSGPDGNVHLPDFWEYDPATNSWTQKADFGGGLRYHAVGESYGNKAYVGTGQTPSGYTNDFYAYDAKNDQWVTNIATFPGSARTSAAAFSIEGKGYVGTGGVGCGTTDFYEYKPETNTWIQRANVGTIIRQEAAGFAVNGRGYIVAGDNCSSGTNYEDVWEYNPQTDSWFQMDDFPGTARRYLDAFVIGNKAYCGLGTSGVNFSDLWEYDQTLSIIQREQNALKISVYPNPVVNHINIDTEENGIKLDFISLKFSLYNQSGQKVFEQQFTSSKEKIDRLDLASGYYIYTITYNDQLIQSNPIILQ